MKQMHKEQLTIKELESIDDVKGDISIGKESSSIINRGEEE